MSNSDQKRFLSSDRSVLERIARVNWIPKEPAKLLLPYMDKDPPKEEKPGRQERLEKARQIVESYKEIEERCKRMEDEISNRCKDVVITLDETKHSRIIEACERVFGREGIREITFNMYRTAVHTMADRSDATTPRPEHVK